jgi:hypothetical protein
MKFFILFTILSYAASIATKSPTTRAPTTRTPTLAPTTSTPTLAPTTSTPTTSNPTLSPTLAPTPSPTAIICTCSPTPSPTPSPTTFKLMKLFSVLPSTQMDHDFEEIPPRMQQLHLEEKQPRPLTLHIEEGNDESISIIHAAYQDWIKSLPVVKPHEVTIVRNFTTFLLRATSRQLGNDFRPNDSDNRLLDNIFNPSKNGRATANQVHK